MKTSVDDKENYKNHTTSFWRLSQNCEKRLLAWSCVSGRLSVRMEQLSSCWRDFHEILYLSIFRNFIEKTQDPLTYGKNNGYFTLRPVYIHVTLLNSSYDEKCFGQKV